MIHGYEEVENLRSIRQSRGAVVRIRRRNLFYDDAGGAETGGGFPLPINMMKTFQDIFDTQ